MRARMRTNLLLLLVWLGLAGWLGYQWLHPPPAPSVPTADGGGIEADIEIEPFRPPRVAELDFYNETVERPVFYPERRPPEPEPEVVAQAPPPPPPEPDVELTLVGVMLTEEGTAVLIRQEDTREVARIGLGEEVAEWRLEQVRPQQVTLSQDGRTRELALERNQRKPSRPPRPVEVRRDRDAPPEAEGESESEELDPQQLIEQLLQRQQSS